MLAEASMAAHEQGKFWEMHDAIFEKKPKTVDAVVAIARELGLDAAKVKEALDTKRWKAAVDADTKEAEAAGIQGTPTTFVAGRELVGAVPLEHFKRFVDYALKEARASSPPRLSR